MDRLANTVRPYAWGSVTAIPELLGTEPTGEPQAELWMGAHPGAPSRLARPAPGTDAATTGRAQDQDVGSPELRALSDVIATDPEGELGPAAVEKFGPRLPFLFKVLAAGAPLSLQVHPNLAQAQEGYADEERRQVPIDAPDRNYKDANHKPELICALTEFNGLCGFRVPTESADFFDALGVDSLKPYADLLRAHPEEAALREALTAILTADRTETAATVTATAAAASRLASDPTTPPAEAAAHAAYASLAHHFPGDPGVLAAILLNHVRLQPGEALFLGAGVPHAYIDGLGVEIMANSDNVLRSGLTPKHVDVPELLRVVRFEATDPGVLRPEATADGEELYATPIDEFRLSRYVLPEGAAPIHLPHGAPQILLCTAGTPAAGDLPLTPGGSVFVPAGEKTELSGPGTVFRATVVV
ncbi:mannose-6-phosphate isomerase, class I [Streptomyces sp. NBC_00237]|uniref:mannose-6-phosphate isomerase, class I n=1 Tax=Streptomyces sp. NBC_00237 TaxID=2975687 RepID=UPI00225ADD5D|nr:mannose-6-phosphate isomerase, class I [Streptomyces sp. NBC_00237]MCX5200833.1 mannose-6-phosphate isomerase, class I [Streptomyces sp. NBC_00237]